uniref:Uncharacterized protein n=1 Tax=Loa loa TaxID=7209 RepID=A0A1I7VBQ3_LOALO
MFEMETLQRFKNLPKPIGYELKLKNTISSLTQRNHMNSPGPSSSRQTEKLSLEEDSKIEKGYWTPWSDDRIEKAIAEALNLKKMYTISDFTTAISSADTILSKTQQCTTKIEITQNMATLDVEHENKQTDQLSEIISLSPISRHPRKSKAMKSRKDFVWNPNALPFVPCNLINNWNTKSNNYYSIVNTIRTSDTPLPFLSGPIGASSVCTGYLARVDQQTSSYAQTETVADGSDSMNQAIEYGIGCEAGRGAEYGIECEIGYGTGNEIVQRSRTSYTNRHRTDCGFRYGIGYGILYTIGYVTGCGIGYGIGYGIASSVPYYLP